jgi:MYXO-CTERM domain-containing protein
MRMNEMKLCPSVLSIVAASSAFATIPSEFGRLTYNSTPINMTSGSGVGNDGYYMNRTTQSFGELLIGIKAHEYRNDNNPAGTSTESQYGGSGLTTGGNWLNINQSTGAYTANAGAAVNKPSWGSAFPDMTRWGFTWSITSDGLRPAAGAMSMNMFITRPDSQVVAIVSGWDVGTNFQPGNMAWQNNWNPGYLAGVMGNGVNASTLGDWKIKIEVLSGSNILGSQEITVSAVPVPGAMALVGLVGLAGGRRRRA